MPEPSSTEIDVVIPISIKDLRVLPICLQGIRANVNNKIKDIYVVAKESLEVRDFCNNNHCVFVEERSVLGFGPETINLIVNGGEDRSGWLFQQLLKLSGKIGSCDDFLCIDADHILINPHTFIDSKGSPVFYMSAELHQPYYNMIRKICSIKKLSLLSYISHKMIFNKHLLAQLREDVESVTGETWYKAIINKYDRSFNSGFSEFELYGNYVSKGKKRPWKQKMLKYSELTDMRSLSKKYGGYYNSLTFPDYINVI